MSISGALSAMIPCTGTLGYSIAGAVGELTSAVLTAIDGGSLEDILLSATQGALTSRVLHGLFSSYVLSGTPFLTKEGSMPIELVTVETLVASYNLYDLYIPDLIEILKMDTKQVPIFIVHILSLYTRSRVDYPAK